MKSFVQRSYRALHNAIERSNAAVEEGRRITGWR